MRAKHLRKVIINDETWRYKVDAVVRIYAPTLKHGAEPLAVDKEEIHVINVMEGRIKKSLSPGAIRAYVEVKILKSRGAINVRNMAIKCHECGKQSLDVRELVDPFQLEIHNKRRVYKMCPKCYHDSAQAI